MKPTPLLFSRSVAILTATSMLASGCGWACGRRPAGAADASRSGSLATSASVLPGSFSESYRQIQTFAGQARAASTPSESRERLEKFFASLDTVSRQVPRDDIDPRVLGETVGPDPIKLFEWVRNETEFVPYRGLLRGETGVLIDRRGNSLDRALLLYRLLRQAGHEVQLVRGQLSSQEAGDVLAAIETAPQRRRRGDEDSSSAAQAVISAFAEANGLDATALQSRISKLRTEQDLAIQALRDRVIAQASLVHKALGIPSGAPNRGVDTEAIREHWWVQRMHQSTWMDLDPTLPSAEPGRALAQVVERLSPRRFEDLTDDLRHRVQIRIVVEQWRRGQLREHEVLRHVLRPSQLHGVRIVLGHQPLGWPADVNVWDLAGTDRITATVFDRAEWMPILTVGHETVSRASFTASGDVKDPSAPILGSGAQDLGQRMSDMFGSSRAGREGPSPASELTAEWIEYQVTSPGRPSRTIRRALFDVLGAARRSAGVGALALSDSERRQRALSVLGNTEVLVAATDVTPRFVEDLILRACLANREAMLDLAGRRGELTEQQLADTAKRLTPMPGPVYALALARASWSRFRDDMYVDQPNILTSHSYFRLDRQGRIRALAGFDIVANEMALRPAFRGDASRVRSEQGVLDTNAEALVLRSTCVTAMYSTGCDTSENTAEMFAASPAQNIEWLAIRSPGDAALARAELPSDVAADVARALAEGYWALVPARAVQIGDRRSVGWWRVHPGNGATLGIGPNNWGQVSAEMKVMYVSVVGPTVSLVCVLGAAADKATRPQPMPDDERYKKMLGCIILGYAGTGSVAVYGTIALGSTLLLMLGGFGAGLGV